MNKVIAVFSPQNDRENAFSDHGLDPELSDKIGIEEKILDFRFKISERLDSAVRSAKKLRDSERQAGRPSESLKPWPSNVDSAELVFWQRPKSSKMIGRSRL